MARNTVRQELSEGKAGVVSFVDDTHPTAAQLFDDAVVRDGPAEQGERCSASGENLRVQAGASQTIGKISNDWNFSAKDALPLLGTAGTVGSITQNITWPPSEERKAARSRGWHVHSLTIGSVRDEKEETVREKLARFGFGPEQDMTEECLARGEYGFLGIGERLSIRLFEDDGIIPPDLREFTESETEGSFFLTRSQLQALVSRLRANSHKIQ